DSVLAGQLAYWRRQLAGLPDELALPVDRSRPAVASHRGARVSFEVPAEVHGRLRELARARGCSMFMLTHAALATLLSRFGAGTDIAIGSPIAGRLDENLTDLVGFFVNTLVLRTDLSGDPTFAELLARVRETDLAAYQHQDVPFEQLVEALNPTRSLARHPLFQTLLTYNNQDPQDTAGVGEETGPLAVSPYAAATDTAKTDLAFTLTERSDDTGTAAGISGRLDYAMDLFDRETAEALVSALQLLLSQVSDNSEQPVHTLAILTEDEAKRITQGWNDTGVVPVVSEFLLDRFERQAGQTPDAVALVCGDEELSYGELNARVNRLARVLAGRGV
ncbi:condensation domain-containing protein, partial [Streptomyces chlorus]